MEKSDYRVVVIGGGAAGIAAARTLRQAGVDALLVEARQRLGGRAWTMGSRFGPLDVGCGGLHSADRNPWAEIAEAKKIPLDRTPPPWSRPAIAGTFPREEQEAFWKARSAFQERLDEAAEKNPDRPAADFLEPGNRWKGLIGAINTYLSGGEVGEVSAEDLARYADSGENWRIADGYGALIAGHGEGLAASLDNPVSRIDRRGGRLRIETRCGTLETDAAIVTLPSTILAEAPDLFLPPLPGKAEAAAGLPLGLADKLFLSLRDAEECSAESRLFGKTDRTATATYHFRPFGRPIIEAYFAGSLAEELEKGGEAAFFAFAADELTAALGADFRLRIKPVASHGWRNDPFARGSYSFARPGRADCRAALVEPVEERIFFAGEATSAHDFSTAHGAYRTGVAAAEAAMKALRGDSR